MKRHNTVILVSIIFIFLFNIKNAHSTTTKEEAISIVLNNILGNNLDSINIYMEPNYIVSDHYLLCPYDSMSNPYDTSWLFFIDDMPLYDWGHDCRYIFVDHNDSGHHIINSTNSPWEYKTFLEAVSIGIDNSLINVIDTISEVSIENANPNSHLYGLIFSGTGEPSFWKDMSHIYCGLKEKYGYIDDNIFVFSGDGLPHGNQNNNWSLDLDQDGIDDIQGACNFDNIDDAFLFFENELDGNDLLYIHIATHGHKEGSVWYLNLFENQRLYDYELAEMLDRVNCSQIIIGMEACYSGGFISSIEGPHRSIKTSTDENTPGVSPGIGLHAFSEYWGTALRGRHPYSDAAPWNPGDLIGLNPNVQGDLNPDDINNGGNGDSYIQLGEANTYCNTFSEQALAMNPSFQFGLTDDLLCFSGLAGEILTSETISGNYLISGSLTIPWLIQLNLDYNSRFFLDNDSRLIVKPGATFSTSGNCDISSVGVYNSIIIEGFCLFGFNNSFYGNGEDDYYLEIKSENNNNIIIDQAFFSDVRLSGWAANLDLFNANFYDSEVKFSKANVNIDNCIFINSKIDLNKGTSSIRRTDITHSTFQSFEDCPLNIKSYDDFLIDECTIENNGGDGIQLHFSGYGVAVNHISDCIIEDNGLLDNTAAGVRVYSSNVELSSDNFISRNPYGVQCLNQSNVIIRGNSYAQYVNETQNITYNDINQVYATHFSFPTFFHYNAVFYNYNPYPLVYHDINPGTNPEADVRVNYWSTDFNPEDDLYGGRYVWEPTWQLDNNGGIETTTDEQMYDNASLQIEGGNYDTAMDTLKLLIAQYPDSIYAQAALKKLFEIENDAGGDYTTLIDYFKTDSVIQSNESLTKTATFLVAMCEIENENYVYAINLFDSIIVHSESYEDSIFAIIDLAYTYDKMLDTNNKSMYYGIFPQYCIDNHEDYILHREFHIDLLLDRHKEDLDKIIHDKNWISDEVSIANIYPNPSSSYFSFEVNVQKKQNVSFTVFDQLGRVCLSDEMLKLKPGVNIINLNLSDFSNGVYFYLLHSGDGVNCTGKVIKN